MFVCCDRPKPMLQEQENRFFCANCRRWLESGTIQQGEGTTPEPTDTEVVGEAKENR